MRDDCPLSEGLEVENKRPEALDLSDHDEARLLQNYLKQEVPESAQDESVQGVDDMAVSGKMDGEEIARGSGSTQKMSHRVFEGETPDDV